MPTETLDPALCRPWAQHNRLAATLTERNCADLIGSILRQGRQEVPAILRALPETDPTHAFEIISGVRRHFAITRLREAGLDIAYLADIRTLTDEEAFRISDLENRARRDLSDYERSLDYERALARHYKGSQREMAERLGVTQSWLCRYLAIAKLPEQILAAFPAPSDCLIRHAARLTPLLRREQPRERILEAARLIGQEQAVHACFRQPKLPASVVVARLMKAGESKPPPATLPFHEIRKPNGWLVAGATWESGRLVLGIPTGSGASQPEILAAIAAILARTDFPKPPPDLRTTWTLEPASPPQPPPHAPQKPLMLPSFGLHR